MADFVNVADFVHVVHVADVAEFVEFAHVADNSELRNSETQKFRNSGLATHAISYNLWATAASADLFHSSLGHWPSAIAARAVCLVET